MPQVALYKTVLQPDNIFSAKVTMENIDMVARREMGMAIPVLRCS